jgi:DinB superfamily
MESDWQKALWSQFGAAIDMLERDIRACPEDVWRGRQTAPGAWAIAHHALFWLDLYLSGAVEGFAPPAPFGREELDPAGRLPDRAYSQSELLAYVEHGRERCRRTIRTLTDSQAARGCIFSWGEVTFAELLLYTLRHVQDHAGELSSLIGTASGSGPGWVSRASRPLWEA